MKNRFFFDDLFCYQLSPDVAFNQGKDFSATKGSPCSVITRSLDYVDHLSLYLYFIYMLRMHFTEFSSSLVFTLFLTFKFTLIFI